jgi:hypothetical protein
MVADSIPPGQALWCPVCLKRHPKPEPQLRTFAQLPREQRTAWAAGEARRFDDFLVEHARCYGCLFIGANFDYASAAEGEHVEIGEAAA